MSNEEKGPNEQQHQSHILDQELNFSISDILSQNHDENDSSFQSIVQTLSNNNGEDSALSNCSNLPPVLQQFFDSSSTEELLSPQNSNTDASMLQMWNRQSDLLGAQSSFLSSSQNSNNSTSSSLPPTPHQSQSHTQAVSSASTPQTPIQSMSPQQIPNQSSPYSQSVSAVAGSPNQSKAIILVTLNAGSNYV
jgi:hypothetical protein